MHPHKCLIWSALHRQKPNCFCVKSFLTYFYNNFVPWLISERMWRSIFWKNPGWFIRSTTRGTSRDAFMIGLLFWFKAHSYNWYRLTGTITCFITCWLERVKKRENHSIFSSRRSIITWTRYSGFMTVKYDIISDASVFVRCDRKESVLWAHFL